MPASQAKDESDWQGGERQQDAAGDVFERGEEGHDADRGEGNRVIFHAFGEAEDAVEHFAEKEEDGDDFQRGYAVVAWNGVREFQHGGEAFDVRPRIAVEIDTLRLENLFHDVDVFQRLEAFQAEDDGKNAQIERVAGAEEVVYGAFEFVEVFVHGGWDG